MTSKSPQQVFFTIIWSILRTGRPWEIVPFLFIKLSSGARVCVRGLIESKALTILKLLRFLPGAVGTAILVGIFVRGSFELSVSGLFTVFVLCIASSLLALSAASLALSPNILPSFWRTWLRFNVHALSFFTVALPIFYFSNLDRVEIAGELTLFTVLWLFSYRTVEYLIDCLIWQKRHRVYGMDIGPDRLEVSESDFWTYCVHEAGHLMLYGVLSRLPEDAFAVVDRRPKYGFGGYVQLLHQTSHISPSVLMMEWQAITNYAGAAAEKVEFGSYGEGAKSDFAASEKLIRRIVEMVPEKPYFPDPKNDAEATINADTIRAMRKQYFDDAITFLGANKTLLREIAEYLRQHESMDCEEFHPYWVRMILPAGWSLVETPPGVACLVKQRAMPEQSRTMELS